MHGLLSRHTHSQACLSHLQPVVYEGRHISLICGVDADADAGVAGWKDLTKNEERMRLPAVPVLGQPGVCLGIGKALPDVFAHKHARSNAFIRNHAPSLLSVGA